MVAGVGLESIPQRVDLDDQGGHVWIGQRGDRGARGVVAGVEALGGVAQAMDGPERLAQEDHGQAG